MLTLSAKIRKTSGKKTKTLREKGLLPAVVYGPKIEALSLELDYKEFEKIYKESGESSLISLEVENKKEKSSVLIHDIQQDPLSDKIIHVDFYQVPLSKEVDVKVPLIFEGIALAVKELGGTLVKDISELEVKSLPQHLPKEIKVDISKLKTFEDHILIKDLKLPEGIKILKDPKEIVANVSPPEKVEEELEKPIEEKVDEVEKVAAERELSRGLEEKEEKKEETKKND
ncbi:50S ribosomal protein L25 [Patescibacteria group bacterium]|nr:50S ribosomal protein L25 [Patescibacteria group bacterium]